MHVGMTCIFQNPEGNEGDPALDAGVYETEYRLADRAEKLGFDSLWGVEHHFNGYAMCPDPLKFLSYFAGRTSRVQLGTMVVVVPWRDPVRVCEDVSVLDQVSGGRVILGMGRGVAKIEFDGFRLNMADSRDLLVENIRAIRMGMETGSIEFSGNMVKQPRVDIRPKPTRSMANRMFGSAQSPATYPLFGELGIGLLFIPGNKSWEAVAADLGSYHEAYETHHGRPGLAPIFAGWVFCDEDKGRARELGRKYIKGYVDSARAHYDVTGSHMQGLKGYEHYAASASAAASRGVSDDQMANLFVENHIYGTPDQCFEKIAAIREKIGAAGFLGVFNYAGMGEEEAARNQALFAQKVLPRLKALEPGLNIGDTARLAVAAE